MKRKRKAVDGRAVELLRSAVRHAYATHLIRTCKDLAVALEQPGHADIRTTMKYSDMTLERKKKAAEGLNCGAG